MAPAKVNLALHVRRRRDDGYHDLETIFAFTEFGDKLTGTAADALTLTAEGEFAGAVGAADDLVLRAAWALAEAAGVADGAALMLTKRIPVAAGLGGGSADAAAALRLLNRLWGLDWPLARLAELGSALGADVPACVFGTPQLGYGRGEVLMPYTGAAGANTPGATLAGTPILLVNPRIAMPTGPVFAGWDRVDRGPLDAALPLADLRNDLTTPASAINATLTRVLTALDEVGAALSRMSGSGATCFGLFADAASCEAARDRIATAHAEWWSVATTLR